jgi:hypothetical protein
MSAARRPLRLALAVLALAGGVAACGADSEEGSRGGSEFANDEGGTGTGGGTNGGGTTGGGSSRGSMTGASEEEIRREEPTATNEVLLGAQFFGERPADFGAVMTGSTRAIAFQLNSLGQPRTIGAMSIVGDHAGDFVLDPGTCATGAVVEAGASCTATITFKPSGEGVRKARLTVDIEPGVSGGRSLEGTGGSAPPPPPATSTTNTDATRSTEETDTTGAAQAGTATAPPPSPAGEADGGY